MFKYHPSYPGNESFLVPKWTDAAISMRHLWQPIVDSYWKTVQDWIVVRMEEQEKVIAWKAAREVKEKAEREAEEKVEREAEKKAERERLQRIKDQERDEKVARELEGRKRKRSEKDIGDPTLKKKKRAQKPKSAPTVAESDDEDGSGEVKIIAANWKMLWKKGIDIVSEDSLAVVHTSSKFSGKPREEPCNHCRYWVEIRRCVTWVCRDVASRKVCATCTTSNVSCATTGEAIQCEKKGGGTPKRRTSGLKAMDEGRPEIFNCLGFVEADLDTIRQTIPLGPQFLGDHLGEDKGLPGALGGEGEEDASGEEDSEIKCANETLGQDDDVVKGKGLVPENVESSEVLEMGGEGEEPGEGSETKGEKATPKAKAAGPSIMESEESEETSEATSGEEEESGGESEEAGNYLPVKGKKSGKKVTKK
ncbi:hypothetical protein M422DRAFT_239690 [Sphaerobolus stellatus SS14]|nr:hypothetical protein M422DRAFT_239690 [Sphaerobolus stellatus SS14]